MLRFSNSRFSIFTKSTHPISHLPIALFNTSIFHIFPEYLILNKINIFNYVSNVENILVMEWVVNLTVGGLVCVKILKEHLSMKMFTVLLVLIVLGIEFILIRNYVNVLLFKRYIYYVSLGLVAVALLLKGKKNSN